LSQRRACRLIGSYRYRAHARTTALRERLRALARSAAGFGYRRLGWMLSGRDEGELEKVYRLYREEGPGGEAAPRSAARDRTRAPPPCPRPINQRWSLDYRQPSAGHGRLPHSGGDRRLQPASAWRGAGHVAARLARDPRARAADRAARKPARIVSDNGTELTSNAVLRWTPSSRSNGS